MVQNKRDSTTITSLFEVYEELKKDDVEITKIYSYTHPKKTKSKMVNMSLGRCWLNCVLPDKIKLINKPVNKKVMNDIIKEMFDKLPVEKASEAATKLNNESFKLSSILPVTFDIDSLIVPEEIKNDKNKELTIDTKIENFSDKLQNISQKYIDKYLSDKGIGHIINSGAKGNASDFGVLTVAKGPTLDIEGKVSKPIVSALCDGYSGEEYYTAAAEARRTGYIRSIGTAQPGYLAKTVVYANSNTCISEDDCRTKKYLELFIKPSMVNVLIGRMMINERTGELVEITNKSNIVNKSIRLRSALFCKSKNGICKTCYGKQINKLNTKHVGLLAGSAINAAGIEGYSMSARHKSTQIKLREADFTIDMLQI